LHNLKKTALKWIGLLSESENYSNPKFVHDFFGKMTKEQIGILVYKHTDHHLRQIVLYFQKAKIRIKYKTWEFDILGVIFMSLKSNKFRSNNRYCEWQNLRSITNEWP